MTQTAPQVVVVNFGMRNLRNVGRAFERAGARTIVTTDPDEVRRADRLCVPGVGSAGDAMAELRAAGLDSAIQEYVRAGRIFLGICVGMQVLLEHAEEGDTECLGLIPGRVAAFPVDLELAVPHMGWNLVKPSRSGPGGEHAVIQEGYFYFVHGYRATEVPDELCLARTSYGEDFVSAVGSGACVGVQYHPEKSQHAGLDLLQRFCRWDP